MCGINGYQGNFNSDFLKKANSLISHRGPDHQDTYVSAGTGLGHVRLSIIDVSENSNQPLHSHCGRYSLVFNGEIYNYLQLKAEMLKEHKQFRTRGDGEVLLELWAQEGVNCLGKLDGIFAFAILDNKTQELFIVRDNFGIKPLYYTSTPEGFLFSSEMKALLLDPQVDRSINMDVIGRMATFLWAPGADTVLTSVKKVLPGEMLIVYEGRVLVQKKYYSPPRHNGLDMNVKQAISLVREQLQHEVDSQLVSDVEVGAFLSGGLDSSLLCAIAKEKNQHFSNVFSINVEGKGAKREGFTEDLPFAKKVAKSLNLDLHTIHAKQDTLAYLPEAIFHLDEPQADPAILNAYLIAQDAKSKGVKVLLSGAGGDDIFTGYRRHFALFLGRYLDKTPKSLRVFFANMASLMPVHSPIVRKLKKFLSQLALSENERIAELFCWLDINTLRSLIPNYRTLDPRDFLIQHIQNSKSDAIEKCLELERDFFLVDHNLNYTDKMGMAHGVEIRVPFVTKGMVNLANKIPTRYKQRGRVGKWILKRAAEKWLDPKVIYRKKTGFGAPLRAWLAGPSKHLVDTFLSEATIKKRKLFDYSTVKRMIEDSRSGRNDYSYTLFFLITLEIWMQQFIDTTIPTKMTLDELNKP